MSLWKRGRQYWTDFTVAGRRYRKRLGTTNLRTATRRERELGEEGGDGRLGRAARGRHRQPHDQHGRRRAVAGAQVLRSLARASGSREELTRAPATGRSCTD